MQQEKSKKRIVWICYFTNHEIQDIIKSRKKLIECCPYVPNTIKILENCDSIDLYIISPHEYISGVKNFKLRNVNYYFFNANMPLIGRHWPNLLKWDLITNYRSNKRTVKKIVNTINPDLIHLQGAEVAYYSSTFIQFIKKFPTILTVQGFISQSNCNDSRVIKKRKHVETEILRNIKHSFFRTKTMAKDIQSFNPSVNLYWNTYPNNYIPKMEVTEKIYDIVFFAKVTVDKGIIDLLEALEMVKRIKRNVKLCVIGSGHLETYKNIAIKLQVDKNVEWIGFLPTQNDVHKVASRAKISVLPTYHDIISGTILESMFLKLPVVAYNVGSIHEVNEMEEIISLVNKFDIEGLAKAILDLLNDEKLCQERAEKGYQRAYELFTHSDEEIRESLLTAYYQVIEDFNMEINN